MALVSAAYKLPPQTQRVIEFKGLNKKDVVEEGEMREMYNLTAERYPLLCPRKPRGSIAAPSWGKPINAITKYEKIAMICEKDDGVEDIDGNPIREYRFYYDGEYIPAVTGLTRDTKMVAINTKICFFPQKIYYHLKDRECHNLTMEASPAFAGSVWKMFGIDADYIYVHSSYFDNSELKELKPDDAIDIEFDAGLREYVIQTGESKVNSKVYYFKVASSEAPGYYFDHKNGSEISDKDWGDGSSWYIYSDYFNEHISVSCRVVDIYKDPTGPMMVIKLPYNTFLSLRSRELKITLTTMSIKRNCPNLAYVMEANNRLWGVSNEDNTIYACKLGDPTNWHYFQQTSVDSYYAEQGSDGDWTGCANYGGHLLFFKEDSITKLYGTAPSSYQTVTVLAQGVSKDSPKSVAVINDMVVYKARRGIMAYDGGVPYEISQKFGGMKYYNVVGGTDGKDYYCTIQHRDPEVIVAGSKDPVYRLLCLDIEKAMWHQHDEVGAKCFFQYDGEVCLINDRGNIEVIDARDPVEDAGLMHWAAEFGPFDEYVENRKVYSKMSLRAVGAKGSTIKVSIAIDDDYDKPAGMGWEEVASFTFDGYGDGEFIPIVPRRCDKFSIRVDGIGECEIKELTRRYRIGTGGKL